MPGTRHPSSREEGGDYRAEEKFGRSRKGEVKTEAREARALLICEWNLMLPQAFPGRGTIPLDCAYSHGGLQKAGSLDVSKRVGRRVSLRVEGLGKGEIEEGGVWPLLAAKTLAGVVSQPSLFLAVL